MLGGQGIEECPIIAQLDAEDEDLRVTRHKVQFCFHCLRKPLQERIGGQALLYPDGRPPWIADLDKQPEESRGRDDYHSEKAAKVCGERKQKSKIIIPKEEIDGHLYQRSFELSDAQLLCEIIRLKKLSKDAAHVFLIELRQRAKAEKIGLDAKTVGSDPVVNPRKLLPWCPNPQSLFPRGLVSVLSQGEQIRFLAICQTVLNSGALRFAHNLGEFKEFQKKVCHERERMASLVLDMIEEKLENGTTVPKNHPLAFMHGLAAGFVLRRWQKRWSEKTFQTNFDFSDCKSTVDWNTRSIRRDSGIRPKFVSTILDGRCDRIELPDLHCRCLLNFSNLYTDFPVSQSSTSIFDDVETLTTICLENDVRIAMDATTACHLMCDPFVGHNYSYAVPIRVIQKVKQGTLANIAILGKPRVLSTVEPATIQRQFIKYLLKTTYVQKRSEAVVNSDFDDASANIKPAGEMQKEFCAPLVSIFSSVNQFSNRGRNSSVPSQSGKNYSVFSIVGSNILVRSRPPPLCSKGHRSLKKSTLSFQPRVEYVPNAGAMCLSEAESMWNYCKGLFKHSFNHGLFRTHYSGKHLLQVQHWQTESFASLTGSEQLWTGPSSKQDTMQMIADGTFRFSRLLGVIGRLEHGDYMLVNKNEGWIQILNQISDKSNGSDILECGGRNLRVSKVNVRFNDAFCGLESVIPLQWQVVQSRAPGCYVAKDSNLRNIADTPLPDGSLFAEYASRRKGGRRRKRRIKENVVNNNQLPEPSYVPPANMEVEGEMTYCPFGSLTEPNSPARSVASMSPCHSPEHLATD